MEASTLCLHAVLSMAAARTSFHVLHPPACSTFSTRVSSCGLHPSAFSSFFRGPRHGCQAVIVRRCPSISFCVPHRSCSSTPLSPARPRSQYALAIVCVKITLVYTSFSEYGFGTRNQLLKPFIVVAHDLISILSSSLSSL